MGAYKGEIKILLLTHASLCDACKIYLLIHVQVMDEEGLTVIKPRIKQHQHQDRGELSLATSGPLEEYKRKGKARPDMSIFSFPVLAHPSTPSNLRLLLPS